MRDGGDEPDSPGISTPLAPVMDVTRPCAETVAARPQTAMRDCEKCIFVGRETESVE